MNENIIEAKYNITKKSKLEVFYNNYKLLIYIVPSIFLILTFCLLFYGNVNEKKKIKLAENYFEAKLYIQNNENEKANDILKEIIFANDNTYSTLALFLVINENLVKDKTELSNLFDHVLENNNFKDEMKNLILFKRALIKSSFENELEMLKAINPLTKSDNVWKPHALLLMGDYFFSKNEFVKSKEFYTQILLLKNIQESFYYEANSRLALIENEK